MKLNYAPQTGLRKGPPEHRRQTWAFWGGIAILAAFELVLMAKSWSPDSAARIFDFNRDRAEAADASVDAGN